MLLMTTYKYVRDKSLHFTCIDVIHCTIDEQEVLAVSFFRCLVRDYFVEHIVEIKWPPVVWIKTNKMMDTRI